MEVFVLIEVEELEKQHLESYKNAVLELISNNTETLLSEDIASLLKQPPLDSMDLIRSKLVSLSKRSQVILDTEAVNGLLQKYRHHLVDSFSDILEDRISKLTDLVKNFSPVKSSDIIKFPKKEFGIINKKIKKEAKKKIMDSNQVLLLGLPTLFKEDTNENEKSSVIVAMEKYLTSFYSKDLLESMELKIVIKDTTVINSLLEQGERYLFTKENSHLFDNISAKDSK